MDKQELDLLYGQIQADDPRNYQPEFPAEKPRPADRGFGGDQQAVEHYEPEMVHPIDEERQAYTDELIKDLMEDEDE